MSTSTRSSSTQVLSKLILAALCVLGFLCLNTFAGCARETGEQAVIDHTIRYASSRIELDTSVSSVVRNMPDAKVEISFLGVEDVPGGLRKIKLEADVVSDTMASWTEEGWAANRDDLFFNLVAHFNVICKQANEYGDVPEDYAVTCPDYMIVYDSQKSTGFVVTSDGVYHKTDDPDHPKGEAVYLVPQS